MLGAVCGEVFKPCEPQSLLEATSGQSNVSLFLLSVILRNQWKSCMEGKSIDIIYEGAISCQSRIYGRMISESESKAFYNTS